MNLANAEFFLWHKNTIPSTLTLMNGALLTIGCVPFITDTSHWYASLASVDCTSLILSEKFISTWKRMNCDTVGSTRSPPLYQVTRYLFPNPSRWKAQGTSIVSPIEAGGNLVDVILRSRDGKAADVREEVRELSYTRNDPVPTDFDDHCPLHANSTMIMSGRLGVTRECTCHPTPKLLILIQNREVSTKI